MIGTFGSSFAAFLSLVDWIPEDPPDPFSAIVTIIVELFLTPASSSQAEFFFRASPPSI